MSTPKQPAINAVLFAYIAYSITEDYIRKMAYSRVSAMSLGPHAHQIYLPAISLSGFTSNEGSRLKPRTVYELKVSIREDIATLPREMLVNVMHNFEERLRTCVRQGRHISDTIFRNLVINISNQKCFNYRLFWC